MICKTPQTDLLLRHKPNNRPKEIIRLITRKLSVGKPKVQFLTLEVLESLTCGCELPFHTQLGQKDFLRLLSAMLTRDIAEPVRKKLIYLFQFWQTFFDSHRDILPQFAENYQQLVKKGIVFPPLEQSKYIGMVKVQPRSYNTNSYSGGGNEVMTFWASFYLAHKILLGWWRRRPNADK